VSSGESHPLMVNTAEGQVVSVPRFRVQVAAGPDAGAVGACFFSACAAALERAKNQPIQ